MKITTWNVNSVRQRADSIRDWLKSNAPDILCLQELKCQNEQFPDFLKECGYHCLIAGQKSYNGVAILTREAPEATQTHLDGFNYDEARYTEVTVNGIDVGNLYLPNGNSGGDTGYQKKLDFFTALTSHARLKLAAGRPLVLIGDYNICPTAKDFAPGALSSNDALIRPESRASWRRLSFLGLTDALRVLNPDQTIYTYWDYQAGALQRNRGLRIDHALLSPCMADRLVSAVVDKDTRMAERASDHAPVSFMFS